MMRKPDYERLSQFAATSLRELDESIEELVRREAEAKKAEETRKAKKRRRRSHSR